MAYEGRGGRGGGTGVTDERKGGEVGGAVGEGGGEVAEGGGAGGKKAVIG